MTVKCNDRDRQVCRSLSRCDSQPGEAGPHEAVHQFRSCRLGECSRSREQGVEDGQASALADLLLGEPLCCKSAFAACAGACF